MVLVDRCDYVSQYCSEWGYCRAIEKLADIEVPERAEWLRTMYAELVRITSHLMWWAGVGADLGGLHAAALHDARRASASSTSSKPRPVRA